MQSPQLRAFSGFEESLMKSWQVPHTHTQMKTAKHMKTRLVTAFVLLAAMPGFADDGDSKSTLESFLDADRIGKVQYRASDELSAIFQKSVLPDMLKMLNDKLGESQKVDDSSMRLDPAKLTLATNSDVRVYFVGEGAGYLNSLGFTSINPKGSSSDPALIFPNASSNVSFLSTSKDSVSVKRTSSAPLLPGDFVKLGEFKAGTQLDFFMIADGAAKGEEVYTANADTNPDKLNHVVAFAMEGSPYLLIGFEDLFGGGDGDFNDLLFAVEIGASNVAALIATPEPAGWLTMAGLLGCVISSATRMRNKKPAALLS